MPERQHLIGHFVRRFLIEEMGADRNLSPNTQKSYRDTIRLLFGYIADRITVPTRFGSRWSRSTRPSPVTSSLTSNTSAATLPPHGICVSPRCIRCSGPSPGKLRSSSSMRRPSTPSRRAGPPCRPWRTSRSTKSMPCSQFLTVLVRRAGATTRCCCFSTTPERVPPKPLGSPWRIWLLIPGPYDSTAKDARSGLVRSGRVPPRCCAICSDHASTVPAKRRSSLMSTVARSPAMAFMDSSYGPRKSRRDRALSARQARQPAYRAPRHSRPPPSRRRRHQHDPRVVGARVP